MKYKWQLKIFLIGKKDASLILEPPKVCDCKKNTLNCADFSTQYNAQQFYLYCLSQKRNDIHRLDGDNDGVACEANP